CAKVLRRHRRVESGAAGGSPCDFCRRGGGGGLGCNPDLDRRTSLVRKALVGRGSRQLPVDTIHRLRIPSHEFQRQLLTAASRSSLSADAAAAELEPQQPLARAARVRGESPFSGGLLGQAGEILARAPIFELCADDFAGAVNGHTNAYLDVAVNRLARTAGDAWNLLMQHG